MIRRGLSKKLEAATAAWWMVDGMYADGTLLSSRAANAKSREHLGGEEWVSRTASARIKARMSQIAP